mgnify:CR=1 FL=1
MAALIGPSFRISAANMFLTSDVLNNSGYIKPKNLVLSTGDSVTDYFKVSGRVSFLDYFRELFSPYFQNKYPGTTEQMLIDLKRAITHYKITMVVPKQTGPEVDSDSQKDIKNGAPCFTIFMSHSQKLSTMKTYTIMPYNKALQLIHKSGASLAFALN